MKKSISLPFPCLQPSTCVPLLSRKRPNPMLSHKVLPGLAQPTSPAFSHTAPHLIPGSKHPGPSCEWVVLPLTHKCCLLFQEWSSTSHLPTFMPQLDLLLQDNLPETQPRVFTSPSFFKFYQCICVFVWLYDSCLLHTKHSKLQKYTDLVCLIHHHLSRD